MKSGEIKEILAAKRVSASLFHLDTVGLEVKETYRPIGFRLAKYAYNTLLKYNGKEYLGCGEDTNSKVVASEKSISEAIERAVFSLSPKTGSSNGWAAHTNLELAAISAVTELAERDSAIKHWLTYTPMLLLEASEVLPGHFLSELKESEFPIPKVFVSFEFSGPLVTVFLMNENGNAVTGHSSGASLGEAVISAAIEACRSAHHFQRFYFYRETEKLLSAQSIESVEPGVHSLIYAYHEPIPSWFFGNIISKRNAQEEWIKSYSGLNELAEKSKFDAFQCLNRTVVHVLNDSLHPMFWGSTTLSIVKQFRDLNPKIFDSKKINFQPHLVG
jgi:hypothetical protein